MVHDRIDAKEISFTPQGPNLNNNPLPGHAGPSVNVVEEVIENRHKGDYHTNINEHDDLQL